MAKPKWDRGDVIRHAFALSHLAVSYRPRLEQRLAPGTVERLEEEGVALRDCGGDVAVKRTRAQSEVCRKDDALRRGARMVRSIRLAIRTAHPTDAALKIRFGVGKRMRSNVRDSVSMALSLALSAAEKHPQQTRAAGILEQDLQELRDSYAALNKVVETHRARRHAAKEATRDRVEIQLRLEQSIVAVLTAATLAFRDEPEVLALFESERPRRHRRRRTQASPEGQVSAAIDAAPADEPPAVDRAPAVAAPTVAAQPPGAADAPSSGAPAAALLSQAAVPPEDAGRESGRETPVAPQK